MDIVICTLGRVNRQITYDNLPPQWQERVTLCVQAHEADQYPKHFNLVVLPEHITTIAPTREWLIHYWGDSDDICMLDDDLVFSARRDDDPTKFRPMTSDDFDGMFYGLMSLLHSYSHASISHREGANRCTDTWVFNSRYMRVLAYDRFAVMDSVQFGRVPVMEDFDVNLQMLRAGYESAILNTYVHNQGGSDTSGGCSTFRTPEVQAEAAERLAHLHPEYVKVVEKETKTSWGGGTRKDVRIQWKKALKKSSIIG